MTDDELSRVLNAANVPTEYRNIFSGNVTIHVSPSRWYRLLRHLGLRRPKTVSIADWLNEAVNSEFKA